MLPLSLFILPCLDTTSYLYQLSCYHLEIRAGSCVYMDNLHQLSQLDSAQRSLATRWAACSTSIRILVLAEFMRCHPDQEFSIYILRGLSDGFHIGYLTPAKGLWSSSRNHPSSLANRQIISMYLAEEVAACRLNDWSTVCKHRRYSLWSNWASTKRQRHLVVENDWWPLTPGTQKCQWWCCTSSMLSPILISRGCTSIHYDFESWNLSYQSRLKERLQNRTCSSNWPPANGCVLGGADICGLGVAIWTSFSPKGLYGCGRCHRVGPDSGWSSSPHTLSRRLSLLSSSYFYSTTRALSHIIGVLDR